MSKTAEVQADSVGALLRQARELKGFTTSDVATHLRLKVSQIEQIEAEEWDPAVSVTFMRGYLRAYARFLKLSEKEILQNFELQTAYLRQQAKPMHSFSKKNRLDAAENRFMLATYLLVVLLIALFLIWFWQTHLLDSQPVSVMPEYRISADESANTAVNERQPTAVSATAASVEAAAVPAQINNELAVPPGDNSQGTISTSLPATPAAETVVESGEPPLSEPQAAQPQAADNMPALQSQQHDSAPVSSDAVAEGTELSTVTVPSQDTALLQLTFSGDCWVTVQDANGKRLAYGMKSAGETLQLTGQLPFSVTLGNAAAASMQLNQTAIDLTGYKAGQVARLTLNGQL